MLRWIFFAVTGFLLYQLFEAFGDRAPRQRRRNDLRRALNENPGRMNVTGKGRGTTATVEDSTGAQSQRVVGRGVVRD